MGNEFTLNVLVFYAEGECEESAVVTKGKSFAELVRLVFPK